MFWNRVNTFFTAYMLILILASSVSATDMAIDDILNTLEFISSSYGDDALQGSFVQDMQRAPDTQEKMQMRIHERNKQWNPYGNPKTREELTEAVKREALEREHRLRKVRVWLDGAAQRIDQEFASPEGIESLLSGPFKPSMTAINTGIGKESYNVDHSRKVITYDQTSRWKRQDALLELIMPLKNAATVLMLVHNAQAAGNSASQIQKENGKSNALRDCLLISSDVEGRTSRTEIDLSWERADAPVITRFEAIVNGKTLLRQTYENYALNEAWGRWLPQRLILEQNDPGTGDLVSSDTYEVLELKPYTGDIKKDIARYLKEECASYKCWRSGSGEVMQMVSIDEILPH